MSFPIIIILEAAILAASLSVDAFVAGFAYGSSKIKIPFLSVQIINIICSLITGVGLLIGSVLREYIPPWITIVISFIILFILGVVKLLDSVTKSIIRKHTDLKREIKGSLFNFKFIINLYADPEKADIDASKTISPTEAVALAISLSLDGLAVGIGAALGNVNGLIVFLFSLITNAISIVLGCFIGNKIAKKSQFNLSWLSGVVLIIMAFLKVI